jgi:hypothetical protein
MRKRLSTERHSCRRGSTLFIAVAALALVAVVMAAVCSQCMASRRLLERRHKQLQADWLARSGVELAADRLLTAPAGYQGETAEPILGARVRIEVSGDSGTDNVFHVTCEARYAGDCGDAVLRWARRSFRRTTRDNQVHLEVVPESRSVSPAGEVHGP